MSTCEYGHNRTCPHVICSISCDWIVDFLTCFPHVVLNASGGCTWSHTVNAYREPIHHDNIKCAKSSDLASFQAECCIDPTCAGFSWSETDGQGGCLKPAGEASEWVNGTGSDGWLKLTGPPQQFQTVTVFMEDVAPGSSQNPYHITDVWLRSHNGTHTHNFTVTVPIGGSVLVRLTPGKEHV
eukprot:m.1144979 g.1144979  ORF g.1144979 m.1144979 type:complete len:183 (-) comp24464_c0_seq20:2596-3144(-)